MVLHPTFLSCTHICHIDCIGDCTFYGCWHDIRYLSHLWYTMEISLVICFSLTLGLKHLTVCIVRKFRQCSSSRKLVILFVVIAAAVIVFWLGGIVSVICSIVLSKSCKPFMRDLTRGATLPKNSRHSYDIQRYTTQKHCITCRLDQDYQELSTFEHNTLRSVMSKTLCNCAEQI